MVRFLVACSFSTITGDVAWKSGCPTFFDTSKRCFFFVPPLAMAIYLLRALIPSSPFPPTFIHSTRLTTPTRTHETHVAVDSTSTSPLRCTKEEKGKRKGNGPMDRFSNIVCNPTSFFHLFRKSPKSFRTPPSMVSISILSCAQVLISPSPAIVCSRSRIC
jgi:hypothetical protein